MSRQLCLGLVERREQRGTDRRLFAVGEATAALIDATALFTAADGRAFGWGLASHGRLGLGNRPLHIDDDGDAFAAEPLPLHSLAGAGARAVAAGAAHALCLMDGGQVYVWGAARAGRLGFDEGALRMPVNEADETAYQPLPRQLFVE